MNTRYQSDRCHHRIRSQPNQYNSKVYLLTLAMALSLWTLATYPGPLTAGEAEIINGVRHVYNKTEPPNPPRTLKLVPAWQIDVMEEEQLIGVVYAAESGPDSTVWLVDRQLGQVHIYSADGEYVRSISREGEGPGEVRQPEDLLWLPNGVLGLIDLKPGKITRMDQDGIPLSVLHLKTSLEGQGGFVDLNEVQFSAGTLAVCGTEHRFDASPPTQNRFFSLYDLEGVQVCRLLEAPSGFDFQARSYDEAKNYFVSQGSWTLDLTGLVHFAAERDQYRIQVHDAAGTLVQVYEREYQRRLRTAAERKEAAGSPTMSIGHEVVEIDVTVEDFDPAITAIETAFDGNIWILSGNGTHDLPEGIYRSYDVFDPQGHYLEVIHLAAALDDHVDALIRLSDGRWVIIKNIWPALASMYGVSEDDENEQAEDEDAPLKVICLHPVLE